MLCIKLISSPAHQPHSNVVGSIASPLDLIEPEAAMGVPTYVDELGLMYLIAQFM
jgi:hypothetical protein